MKKYGALVLDVDGTFVDSYPGWVEAIISKVGQLGWPTDETVRERLAKCWGSKTSYVIEQCWPGRDWQELQPAINAFNREVVPPLFPHARTTLDRLRKMVRGLCVFTGRHRDETEHVLMRHGIIGHFNRVITRDDIQNTKPHQEGLELAMSAARSLGIRRSEVLMVGDSAYSDGGCARAAEVDFLAVAESANVSRSKLTQDGIHPSFVIDRFADLPAWLTE